MCIYIFLYVLAVSSPYLFVFGNDPVRGTHEQVMMQVELVRLSYGDGIAWDFYFYDFESVVNIYVLGLFIL